MYDVVKCCGILGGECNHKQEKEERWEVQERRVIVYNWKSLKNKDEATISRIEVPAVNWYLCRIIHGGTTG